MKSQSSRIEQIIDAEGLSNRAFAKGVGIPIPSLASSLSKDQKISSLWAYAIEAKYGYSANWILTGEGEQKELVDNRDQAFNRMISETIVGFFDEGKVVSLIEPGLVKIIEMEIEKNRKSFIRRINKNISITDKERFRRISEESENYFKLKNRRESLLMNCYNELDNQEFLMLLFYVFTECIRKQKHEVEYFLIDLHKLTFTKRVQPLAGDLMKNINKSFQLWCLDK